MRKPEVKPTIARLNRTLLKLEAAGMNTYSENLRERAFWSRLHKAKPKAMRKAA